MNKLFVALCAVYIVACVAQLPDVYPNGGPALLGDVVFVKSWEDGLLNGWASQVGTGLNHATFIKNGYQGKRALQINAPDTNAYLITTDFGNPGFIRGTTIRLSATVRAINVSSSTNPSGGVKVMLAVYDYDGNSIAVQKTGVFGTFGWSSTAVDIDFNVPGNTNSINCVKVTIGLMGSTGTVQFDNIRITVIKTVPPIPATLLWNLTTECQTFGIGIIKPVIDCETGNVPAGYTIPNTFQVRIGPGPFLANDPASECQVSYLVGPPTQITVYCEAYTPDTNGAKTYPIYVRNSITQSWVLTRSTTTTHWGQA